jgi:hypothetical protein
MMPKQENRKSFRSWVIANFAFSGMKQSLHGKPQRSKALERDCLSAVSSRPNGFVAYGLPAITFAQARPPAKQARRTGEAGGFLAMTFLLRLFLQLGRSPDNHRVGTFIK